MNIFVVVLGVIAGWLLASIRKIGPTEQGVTLFFGRPIKNVPSGLVFVPWGICSLIKETRLVRQQQYPDDPEKVWKGDGPVPEGMMAPIRVVHFGKDGEDSLSRRITSEASIIVRYQIDDLKVFIQKIGSVKEAERQLRDAITAKVREDLAKKTPAETLAEWGAINDVLKTHVEAMVSSWGVTVEDVRLEEVDLGKTVNSALRNVPAAELEKQARATRAEAKRIELEKEGRGNAKAAQLLLEAQAKGSKALAEELKIEEGEIILAMRVLEQALKAGNQVIISGNGGLGDLITMAKSVVTAVKPATGATT